MKDLELSLSLIRNTILKMQGFSHARTFGQDQYRSPVSGGHFTVNRKIFVSSAVSEAVSDMRIITIEEAIVKCRRWL